MKTIQGKYNAKGLKMAVIAARFNEFFSGKLLEGSKDCFLRHNGEESDLTIFWVPGSFEIPLTAKKIAETGKYDAVICLGAVIRGATPHFDYVSAEVSKGIANVGLQTGVPIVFGVITTDNIEQAIERSGTKAGNKGWDAMLTAIEVVDLYKQI